MSKTPPRANDYITADQSILAGSSEGATSGFNMSNFFGFGVINITVPSYTQLFSENRKNLNNSALDTHAPSFIIGHDLSYAKYHPLGDVHKKFPSQSYKRVKSVIDSTALLSMGDNSDFIDTLPTHLSQGKNDFTYDNIRPLTKKTLSADYFDPRRNNGIDVEPPFTRTGGPPEVTACGSGGICEQRFGSSYCNPGGYCDTHQTGIYIDPNTGQQIDCCDCCSIEPGITVAPCIEGTDCGSCKTCTNGFCQPIADCCAGGACDSNPCPVCKRCEESSDPNTGCYTCVNDTSDTSCSCPWNDCPACSVCNGAGGCDPITCNPGVNGGFFDIGDEDCCPGNSGGSGDNGCDINPCDVDQNRCCTGDGECVECPDPCPLVFAYSYDTNDRITSIKGNYTPRDLYVPGYFVHDMNEGYAGAAKIIQSNDIIMSCVLELTVKNVYGRLAHSGAKPYVRPTQFNIYRVKQQIEPQFANYNYYNENEDAWSAPYGRHPDDIDIDNVMTFTVGTGVKSGDKLNVDITRLAKIAQSQDDGVIRLMIEPTSYFAAVESGTSEKLGKQTNARSTAMLLEFYDSGNLKPKMRINIHQGLRAVTSRRFPWLKNPS